MHVTVLSSAGPCGGGGGGEPGRWAGLLFLQDLSVSLDLGGWLGLLDEQLFWLLQLLVNLLYCIVKFSVLVALSYVFYKIYWERD